MYSLAYILNNRTTGDVDGGGSVRSYVTASVRSTWTASSTAFHPNCFSQTARLRPSHSSRHDSFTSSSSSSSSSAAAAFSLLETAMETENQNANTVCKTVRPAWAPNNGGASAASKRARSFRGQKILKPRHPGVRGVARIFSGVHFFPQKS